MAARMAGGVRAIISEFEAAGTPEDLRYLRQVLDQRELPPEMQIPGWQPMSHYYAHANARAACLEEGHVLALRMYTTPGARATSIREQRRGPLAITGHPPRR